MTSTHRVVHPISECYDMDVFIDRRRPKVEAQPYMRWQPVLNGFLLSLPIWGMIFGLGYFIYAEFWK